MEKITCPNCDHKFDIEGALAKDLSEQFEQKLKTERQQILSEFKAKEQTLNEQQTAFEEKKKKENELFAQRLTKAVQQREVEVKQKVNEEFEGKLLIQKQELEEKTEKIKALQTKELELAKMERRVNEMEKDMEIKMQRKLLEEQKLMEDQISKRLSQVNELKLLEKDKKLEEQGRLIEEMKRKHDQGSMQMQGEILELAIENMLRQEFPQDVVQEIPKGATGADVLQTVMTDQMDEAGKIVYESKRTKAFANDWIAKLKKDQRTVQGDIAVLVTEVMPKGMERFGEKGGVWICTFQESKSLVFVLRQMLIRTSEAKAVKVNKGDKMELLYHFLTSEEFKLQLTGIVDGFQGLQNELNKEKRAMQSIWKRREKQLEAVIGNTIDMYGSIKGIAGKAIPTISHLELPEGDLEA